MRQVRKTLLRIGIILIAPILIVALIWGVFAIPNAVRTFGWQTLITEEFGTFRVPDYWVLAEKCGIFYFSDRELEATETFADITLYMIQSDNAEQTLNLIYENVERVGLIRSRAFSNDNVGYSVTLYRINGVEVEKVMVGIRDADWNNVWFVGMDESVTAATVRRIALSFEWQTRITFNMFIGAIFWIGPALASGVIIVVYMHYREKKKQPNGNQA